MMLTILRLLLLIPTALRLPSEPAIENLAFRRQLAVSKPRHRRPRLRKGLHGLAFRARMKALDIEQAVIAPHSPWQHPYVERVFGTLRRECLDHVVVLGEFRLSHMVRRFLSCYHGARMHLALDEDAPEARAVQPPDLGSVIEIAEVGGLHQRYERRAA